MADYSQHFSQRATPQIEPIAGTVENSAGGQAYPVDDWTRLDRFLVLGSEGGSYYAGERALTRENAGAVVRCLEADGPRAVGRIVEISGGGRAPKNDPAIFALTLAASAKNTTTRQAAIAAIPHVCRTGTHLFQFAEAVQAQRGWGRSLRRGIANWYVGKAGEKEHDLALQLIKYRQRGGWTHRDLLRLAHPVALTNAQRAMFEWACRGTLSEELHHLVSAFAEAQTTEKVGSIVELIRSYGLPREAIPTQWLNDERVWNALLDRMPMTAMVRNLGKMSAVGLLKPLSDPAMVISARLNDERAIRNSRLHPLAILLALRTYASGHGDKGKLSWEPVPQIIDALNAAFYKAFANVEPTNKRVLLALDVSSSMTCGGIAGSSITPREGSAAMALMTAATEKRHYITAFTSTSASCSGSYSCKGTTGLDYANAGMIPLNLSPSMRLDDAVRAVSGLPFGGTDCALPMLYALEKGLEVDAFVIYTDSETWAGNIHPSQALRQYREKTGIPAKIVVVGMVSNGFTIADPNDAGMMDVVGFDAAAPAVIADLIRT